MPPPRDPRTPVEVEEQYALPPVWFTVLIIVGLGVALHLALWTMGIGGLMLWPFIFSICVLLLINDAAEESGGGVPALQAYGAFFGTLVGMVLFVMLVSQTINPWLLFAGIAFAAVYLARDWKERKVKQREIDRRRAAGVCVRCLQPVIDGPEEVCENCGLEVNPERMNLLRLGRAMANRAESRQRNVRQVLTGTGPKRSDAKLANLQAQRAARYKRGK